MLSWSFSFVQTICWIKLLTRSRLLMLMLRNFLSFNFVNEIVKLLLVIPFFSFIHKSILIVKFNSQISVDLDLPDFEAFHSLLCFFHNSKLLHHLHWDKVVDITRRSEFKNLYVVLTMDYVHPIEFLDDKMSHKSKRQTK